MCVAYKQDIKKKWLVLKVNYTTNERKWKLSDNYFLNVHMLHKQDALMLVPRSLVLWSG